MQYMAAKQNAITYVCVRVTNKQSPTSVTKSQNDVFLAKFEIVFFETDPLKC